MKPTTPTHSKFRERAENLVYSFKRIWDCFNDPSDNLTQASIKYAESALKAEADEALEYELKVAKRRISRLEEALGFYADKFTWRSNSGKVGIQRIYFPVEKDGDCEIIDGQFTAGYRARKVLHESDKGGEGLR